MGTLAGLADQLIYASNAIQGWFIAFKDLPVEAKYGRCERLTDLPVKGKIN